MKSHEHAAAEMAIIEVVVNNLRKIDRANSPEICCEFQDDRIIVTYVDGRVRRPEDAEKGVELYRNAFVETYGVFKSWWENSYRKPAVFQYKVRWETHYPNDNGIAFASSTDFEFLRTC